MANFIEDITFDVITDVILAYPGAAIRWVFLRNKKTFKQLLKDPLEVNALVAVVALVLVLGIYFYAKQFI